MYANRSLQTIPPIIVTGGLGGLGVMLAGFVPMLAGLTFATLGWISLGAGALFTAIAAWFMQANDEPGERVLWGIVGIFAVLLTGYAAINAWEQVPTWIRLVLVFILIGSLVGFYVTRKR